MVSMLRMVYIPAAMAFHSANDNRGYGFIDEISSFAGSIF